MVSVVAPLKAPFPWFGGKSRVASIVWDHIGDVNNYIEPFAGSAAVLLARPTPPRIETLNDMDCYVANFWRATSMDPEAVAFHADWPINEVDMCSRHRWLVLSDDAEAFRVAIRENPDYFDAKIAGRWCWGLCCWIGSGWCKSPESVGWDQTPMLNPGGSARNTPGKGVNGVNDANRPQLADAYSRGRGVHGNDSAGTCDQRRAWLLVWFGRLRDRLRTVRVCCGDWRRVCNSPSVTTRLGSTGIFLDPPYSAESGRSMKLYSTESGTVAHAVRDYCLERGSDPMMRLVLCGYEGEGHEELERHGWGVVAWKADGGYGSRSAKGKENSAKERLWISPHCLKPEHDRMPLFAGIE